MSDQTHISIPIKDLEYEVKELNEAMITLLDTAPYRYRRDYILRLLKTYGDVLPSPEEEDPILLIGTLNKRCVSMKGYETPEIGHSVFLIKDKYVVYMKNEKTSHAIQYYKDTLKPHINFYE